MNRAERAILALWLCVILAAVTNIRQSSRIRALTARVTALEAQP